MIGARLDSNGASLSAILALSLISSSSDCIASIKTSIAVLRGGNPRDVRSSFSLLNNAPYSVTLLTIDLGRPGAFCDLGIKLVRSYSSLTGSGSGAFLGSICPVASFMAFFSARLALAYSRAFFFSSADETVEPSGLISSNIQYLFQFLAMHMSRVQ